MLIVKELLHKKKLKRNSMHSVVQCETLEMATGPPKTAFLLKFFVTNTNGIKWQFFGAHAYWYVCCGNSF